MKKFFSLALVLFAMIFAANAQYLLNEGFEDPNMNLPTGWTVIDNDGDGNNWYVLNNSQSSSSSGYNVHSGDGHITSASYNGSALTPDNWLITPQINLTTDATLTFWMAGQDASYAAEYFSVYVATTPTVAAFTATTAVASGTTTATMTQYTVDLSSYTGQQVYIAFRHHNVSDMFRLNLDDVQISFVPTSPTIVASTQNVNFGSVLLGSDATQQVSVTAFQLTTGISATVTGPYTISADGTTFGTTASIAQTGGTLYVKYTPTAAGTDNGFVTLSSTGATSVTIDLTGNCLDCSNNPIPYTCDFTDATQLQCWSVIDANNDGKTFGVSLSGGYAAYQYSSANSANDWLISPAFTFTGTQSVMFDYKTGSSWEEIYEVFAIGTDTVRLSQPDTVLSSSYLTKVLDVSNLNGSYSIAIHCISEPDMFYLYITNFTVIDASNAIVTVDETDLDFGVIPVNSTAVENFNINTTNLNEAIAITTAAPFEVSLDGTTYSASVTVPADSAFITSTPVYVRFAPTAAGSFNNVVVVATTNTSDTIALTGVGVSCDAITTFPFTENFADASTTLPCWEIVDANNDDNTFEFDNGEVVYSYSSDENANDYLISPALTLTSGLYGHIDYAVASAGYPEKLSVYVIPENGTIANAVNIVPTMTITNEDPATLPFDLSAYANQTIRVAFKAESDADMYELILTNFMVEALPASATITVDPTSMDFITEVGNTTREQAATVTAYVLTNDITVSTAAPFEVSMDGNTYGTSATIPAGNIVSTTIYVRYAPTTPGTQTGTVTLTSGSATATISLTGEGVDCSAGIASLPFIHDFNDAVIPPFCWSYENEESFLRLNVDEETGDYGVAIGQVDYLMTPEIHTTTSMNFSFDYATYGGSASSSTFRVGYASTNNINNFTWLTPVTVTEDIEGFERYSANIPSGAKYIAIQATEIGEFQYWFSMYPNYVLLDNITIAEGDGIEDITSEDNVNLYPNPANNVINVNAASNINTIEVFNMMGQRVSVIDANDTNVQINTTALSNGMYMMRITTENGVSNQKFTVAR